MILYGDFMSEAEFPKRLEQADRVDEVFEIVSSQ
jgi:hypothetical protein